MLGTRPVARSARFALHHLRATPGGRRRPELSTGAAALPEEPAAAPAGRWLGLVVPKRHARRAVTRSLLKRQMRACFSDLACRLDAGLWVIRLKAPFDRQAFPSAASDALRRVAAAELREMLERRACPDAA